MQSSAELQNLRRAALEIFSDALKEADAGSALRRSVHMDGPVFKVFDADYNLESRDTKLYAIAIGKAARSMATALDNIVGHRLTEGIVAAPSPAETEAERDSHQSPLLSSRWKVFDAGHPTPNQSSLYAARAGLKLLQRAEGERALVLFLISGGGSANFEWPVDERITLEDLSQANRVLVSCGATIAEVNAVRRAISAVKGGRLAAIAPSATQVSLIVSDTNPGEESTVASGPTFAPPEDAPDARDVISRYRLEKSLPSSILRVFKEAPDRAVKKNSLTEARHFLLLDNRSVTEAASRAARARGFAVSIASDVIEQPVEEGCAELISRLRQGKAENSNEVVCLISGGEFACPVLGDGVGGRNQETVLRCALALDVLRRQGDAVFNSSHTVVLSAGTDGIDGNSPAAGAICDETTIERARALKLDARRSLEQSDAYTFFQALNEALITGQTGTNVRDLRIMLAL